MFDLTDDAFAKIINAVAYALAACIIIAVAAVAR